MKRILWSILILLALVVGGCGYKQSINGADTGTGDGTGDGTGGAGFVNYTVPNDGATGIGRYADLFIVFNQAMNPLTVTDAAFSVVCGTDTKDTDVSYDAANQAAKIGWGVLQSWGENNTCTVTAKGGSLRTSNDNLMGEDYVFTFSTSSGSSISKLNLSASKLTLDTNGTDTIEIIVYAKDANNAAASNATISVASDGGFLSVNSITTDTTGQATFTLGVGDEKSNGTIKVTLTAGDVEESQTITISGTTLALTATKYVTTTDDTDLIELTATLRDAAGLPINDATINFTSALGNTFTPSAAGKTVAGLCKVNYKGTKPGIDTVTVAGSGATDKIDLTVNAVSKASFGFIEANDQDIVYVDKMVDPQPLDLKVQWIKDDGGVGTPVSGETLTFFTNKGYFNTTSGKSSTTAPTDVAGIATVQLSTGLTAGPMTITVYGYDKTTVPTTVQTASLILQVRATTPAAIDLQVNPGVIPVSTVTAAATATLKATVRDINNQAVAGKVVGFSILYGPGAGEFISPVTAITDDGGVATSTLTSGSGASAQDGVKVQATVQGVDDPATATMTIAQKAATVSIGTSNVIEEIEDTKYKLPFTVLVTNSSGGAVAGAPVILSLAPIRFYTGVGGASIADVIITGAYQAEDTNRNYILDPGEDCAQKLDPLTRKGLDGVHWEDGSVGIKSLTYSTKELCLALPVDPLPLTGYQGNGRLDPGAVASIDPVVTTGADGMAIFYVYYPKSYGNWVDVEITATADVSGTNASAKIETYLQVKENDTPYLSSPFGFEVQPLVATVAAGDKSNVITWDAVAGATSYNLYWSTSPGLTTSNWWPGDRIGNAISPYTHGDLTNGTTYYYIVAPVSKYGDVGQASTEVSATPTAPPAPTP